MSQSRKNKEEFDEEICEILRNPSHDTRSSNQRASWTNM